MINPETVEDVNTFDDKGYVPHIFSSVTQAFKDYKIDYKKYSLRGKLIERLEAFCSFFDVKLELNNNMTFKRGSYEAIKDAFIKSRYPHWFSKQGSNKIWKIFQNRENNGYKFERDMIDINNDLQQLRRDKCTLNGEDGEGIAKTFKDFLDNISQTNHPDIEYEISSKPLIWTRRSQWASNNIGTINAYTNQVQRFQHDAPNITLPLFCNIKVKLSDTNIAFHSTSDTDSVTYKTIDWGDLVIYMTFPIQRILDNANNMYGSFREVICIHTDLFPNYPGTRHPFVSREWGGYAHGNTCFGSFPIEELILQGKLMESLIHMRTWASSYDVHRTSPINNARTTYYSLENHEGVLSNDSTACETALIHYTDTTEDPKEIIESHLGSFCDGCICKRDCHAKDRMLAILTQRSPLEDLAILEDFVRNQWCVMFPEGQAVKWQQLEILDMLTMFRKYMPSTITTLKVRNAAKRLFNGLTCVGQSGPIVDVLHNLHVTDAMGRSMRTAGNLEYRHVMRIEEGVIVEDELHGDTIIQNLSGYKICLNIAYLVSLLITEGKVNPNNLSALGEKYSIVDLQELLIESCETNAYIGKDKIELPFSLSGAIKEKFVNGN
tara:strand:+ start:296 stop:2116 length:1821 start_codon:yes stop_codon:yes gene_type:complete